MVLISSSRGGNVNVEIKGISETLRFLRKKGKDIEDQSEVGILQAANFMQQEVQESIIGRRSEMKSVDTGRFANSISVDKINKSEFRVFPERVFYPRTNVTTQKVAKFLEFGTSRTPARRHFTNSLNRNKKKIVKIVFNRIKKV